MVWCPYQIIIFILNAIIFTVIASVWMMDAAAEYLQFLDKD